jgi:hypothetical protein
VFFFGGTGWNQDATFAMTRALVEQRTVSIDHIHTESEDVAFVGNHIYSNKAPGLSFMASIPYSVLYVIERHRGIDVGAPLIEGRNQYLCSVVICAGSAALIALLIFHIGIENAASERSALAAALLTSLATQILPYSTMLYPHVPNAAALLLAFEWSRRGKNAAAGAAAGVSALLNYLCLPVVLFFAIDSVMRSERRLKAARNFVAGSAIPLALLVIYQESVFGALFRNPITKNARFVSHGASFGIVSGFSFEALFGITFSSYRGLFYFAPILILSLPGILNRLRQRIRVGEIVLISAIAALFFAFNVTFNGWSGGNGFGPRYLIPIIPFFGLFLMNARAPRWLFATLGSISFAFCFIATAVNPQVFEHIHDPFWGDLLPTLITGRPNSLEPWLAVGRTSIGIGSFNLGEILFGSGHAASLVPVLVWIGIGSAVLLRRSTDAQVTLDASKQPL